MLRVSLRSIRAHLVRFVLSVLAVALGVAFVAGTFSLRSMLSGTFDALVDASTAADVYVRTPTSVDEDAGDEAALAAFAQPSTPVPLALQAPLEGVEGARLVLPEVAGSVVLVGADGTAVQVGQAPSIALPFYPDDPSVHVVDGSAPQGTDEIALEAAGLEASGLAVGDSTRIVVAGEVREVTVTAEVAWDVAAGGATIVLLPEETALADFGVDGAMRFAIYADPGVSAEQLAERVTAVLATATAPDGVAPGADLEAATGAQIRAENKDAISSVLGFVTTFLLVFAAIALFVGAFIIANTFSMSVRQRMREFAMLRAVGASPLQVFGSILVQAAVVGLVGSVIGAVGGILLVVLLRVVLDGMGMSLSGEIPVEIGSLAIAVGVGTVVSMVAAAFPARRASLVPPVEAMREETTVHERSLRLGGVLGGSLVLLGVVCLAVITADPGRSQRGWWLGVGAAGVVLGVLVASPVLARWVLSVLAWPFARWFRPLGTLARGNVVRHPRRTANTAAALLIGMALVGAASVIAASTQASVSSVVDKQVHSDLILTGAAGSVPAGAVDAVEKLPEVGNVDVVAFAIGSITTPAGEPVAAMFGGVSMIGSYDVGAFGTTFTVDPLAGDPAEAIADGQAVLNVGGSGDGPGLGDQLVLSTAAGSETVTIGAVVSSTIPAAPVTVSPEVLGAIAPPQAQTIDSLYVDAAEGVSVEELRDAVTGTVAPFVVIAVMTPEQYVDQLAAQVDQVLTILYALLGLSIVIAVLGIVNTLALSVIERTREIGLLRAVGLGRLQLAGTVMIESVLIAVFGTVVGLVVGVAVAATMPTIFSGDGLSELAIPWGQLGIMLAIAVVVGIAAAVWPASRAARLRVLDAIAHE